MIANALLAMQAIGLAGVQFDAANSSGSAPSRPWSRPWRSGIRPA